MRSINLLFLFGIRRNCLRSGRSQSLYLSIRRATKQNVVIIEAFANYIQNFIQHPAVKVNSVLGEVVGDNQCGFQCYRSSTDHISYNRQILEKKWDYNEAVHKLSIDFKKSYDSVRREVLYNILFEFGFPIKLVWLIKIFLIETYSRVRVGKHLSEIFSLRNGLKQGDALLPLLFNFALEYTIRRF